MLGRIAQCNHDSNGKDSTMRINALRGTVADQPIDARVVQQQEGSPKIMDQILTVRPEVQQVDASRLSDYDKG